MNLPKTKKRDGVIGIRDFRGGIIREHEKHGWIYHSEVCVWKDPVTAMQRTKAIGLLHKQIIKDSSISRQGCLTTSACSASPAKTPNRSVVHLLSSSVMRVHLRIKGDMSIDVWQRYASPVWSDIRQTRTLNKLPRGQGSGLTLSTYARSSLTLSNDALICGPARAM